MGNKILIMILATFAMVSTAFADHHEGAGDGEKKPFSIYGDFASSIQFHSAENQAANGGVGNRHDDFIVDLAEINVEKNWSHSRLHLGVGYGATPQAYNNVLVGAAAKNSLNLTNANYTMNSSYGLSFMIGKFASPLSMESYNHMNNAHYTRTNTFNRLTPQFHTGLGIMYTINPMFDVAFYAVNTGSSRVPALDNIDGDNNRHKNMILTVGINPMEQLAVNAKYSTGVDGAAPGTDSTIMSVDASYMVNEMIDVALAYTSVSTEARNVANATKVEADSIAAYVNANLGMFKAGLRYETLNDKNLGFVGGAGTDNKVDTITLTAKADIDQNATLALEYLTEKSDDKIYQDKDGAVNKDSFDTITLGLMYRF